MAEVLEQPRARRVATPSRGPGEIAVLEYGPQHRPVDIVFLHANGFNALTYRTILAPLAADYRILTLDQRGHGATTLSTVTEGREGWNDLREDLVAFLDAEDLSNVVLGGHSMGGTASLMAAAARPDRVKALALFDPVILPPQRMTPEAAAAARESNFVQGALKRRSTFDSREAAMNAYRGRGAFRTWPEAVLADYVAAGFKDAADGQVELACAPSWEASNFMAQGHDPWDAFDHARCPISILKAETASTCNIESRQDALLATGRVKIELIPGTTHFLPMERPDLVERELRAAASS